MTQSIYSQMHNRLDGIGLKNLIQEVGIPQIALKKEGLLRDSLAMAFFQTVEDHHGMASGQKGLADHTAYV